MKLNPTSPETKIHVIFAPLEYGNTSISQTVHLFTEKVEFIEIARLRYGYLCIMNSSLVPRETKIHILYTSIIRKLSSAFLKSVSQNILDCTRIHMQGT